MCVQCLLYCEYRSEREHTQALYTLTQQSQNYALWQIHSTTFFNFGKWLKEPLTNIYQLYYIYIYETPLWNRQHISVTNVKGIFFFSFLKLYLGIVLSAVFCSGLFQYKKLCETIVDSSCSQKVLFINHNNCEFVHISTKTN